MEPKIKTSTRSIQPVVTIIKLYDSKSDFQYWQTQSYIQRLDALEQIRQEYHHWRHGAEPRFQRIYSIVKR